MTTTTRQTKAGEIKRTISVSFALADTCEARVTETHGHKITTDTYLLCRQPSDFGIAFRVRKCDSAESYDVLLNQPGGGHSCDCRWGTYKGHLKPCRHVEMCLAAVREGKLPGASTKPESKSVDDRCPECGGSIRGCTCLFDNP